MLIGSFGCAVSVPVAEDDLVLGELAPTGEELDPSPESADLEDTEQRSLTPTSESGVTPTSLGGGGEAPAENGPIDEESAAPPADEGAEEEGEPDGAEDAEGEPNPDEAAAPTEPPSDEETPQGEQAGPALPEEEAEPPPPEPLPDPNLVSNPSFEFGLEGWAPSFGAQLERSTERAQEGLASALITNRTDSWQGAQFDLAGVVTSDAEYQAAISVSVGSQAPTPVLFTVQVQCAGQADQFVPIATGTASELGWTRLSGPLRVPSATACDLTGFLIYAEGPPAGVDLFVDQVSVLP